MDKEREYKIEKIEKLDEDSALVIEHICGLSMADRILGIISGSFGLYTIGDFINQIINNDNRAKSTLLLVIIYSLCTFMCLYKHFDKEKQVDELIDKEYKRLYLDK